MTHPHRRNTNWPNASVGCSQHGTIHESLYNAFSFGLFAAYELESEDRELVRHSSRTRPSTPAAGLSASHDVAGQ
jgi:hypothetical protein